MSKLYCMNFAKNQFKNFFLKIQDNEMSFDFEKGAPDVPVKTFGKVHNSVIHMKSGSKHSPAREPAQRI